jgi:transcriptional regulator GlxA family with amidase domain
MIDEINREREANASVSRALVRGLFFRLLVFLARQHAQQRTGIARYEYSHCTAAGHNVAEVLQFCDEHFCESLSVPQLAAMMFLSPGRFSEVFAREVGMPPATYLRRLRLERAQTLLRTTSLSQPRSHTAPASAIERSYRAPFAPFSAPRPAPIEPHTRVEF